MTFDDLVFEENYPNTPMLGVRAAVYFVNDYGASIICGPHSYGGSRGLYEMALLLNGQVISPLIVSDEVRNNVIGWLTPEQVTVLLGKIEALPDLK